MPGKMEDCGDIAFECILLPSTLDSKVFTSTPEDPQSRRFAFGVLRELLTQLSTVKKTQLAANNESTAVGGGGGAAVAVAVAAAVQQADAGSLKKKAVIQLMVVRIASFLSWDIKELNDVPALQLLLLETLISVVENKSENAAAVTVNGEVNNGKNFAKILYHRWVLRTTPILNYPAPPANKAQIFNSGGTNVYCLIDPPTATAIQASTTEALKSLNEMANDLDNNFIDYVPSKNSFKLGSDLEKEFLPECIKENWLKINKNFWSVQILTDLSGHFLFLEDYDGCRNCMKKLKSIDSSILDKVVGRDIIKAYETATKDSKESANDKDKPLYKKINEELNLKYKGQQKAYETLLVKNTPLRIEAALPFPHSEEALKKADLKGLDTFVQYLNEVKTVSYGKPPNFSDKMDKSKSKPPKNVRKRDLLLTLMREKRPEKILKLIQDLQKMSVNVRRAVTRWHLDDLTIVQAADRSIDSDYVFVMLVKIQQLIQMKAFEEATTLIVALERLIDDKPWSNEKAKAMHYIQMQKVRLRMTEYQECKGQNMEDKDMDLFIKDVKDCFDKLISVSNATDTQSQVFEMLVATLLNLEEFDFILARSDKCWNMIRLACLISNAVVNFHRKHINTGEFKETCRALAEIILPVLQQGGNKRTREINSREAQERQWIKRLLRRLHSPQVLSLLCAFLVTYYNSINEDASLEIQCELPPLPLTVNSSVTINEDNLLSFIQMLAKNSRNPSLSWSLRIQGEIHYAQGNYLAAMQNFIKALIVSTQFFLKPWIQSITDTTWDERIFIKMIKCTSELGHHAESMILCQFQGEVDYVTAFKALEERNGFDGMDSLYQYLWDVTILEYAVSMHNKKGEVSRKKKALETISQLEINTNNNEEILREAQAARRSAFLRYMAANYIQST